MDHLGRKLQNYQDKLQSIRGNWWWAIKQPLGLFQFRPTSEVARTSFRPHRRGPDLRAPGLCGFRLPH
jgi:hypothetical protein